MSGAHILLLGAGRVGRAIALDLAPSYAVTVADISLEVLSALQKEAPSLQTVQADFRKPEAIQRLLTEAELVIIAVPGSMGYAVLKAVITAGKKVVDISFSPEDPYTLEACAQEANATVIVDAGVAPGLSNFLLGYELTRHAVVSFTCYVGGLPVGRPFPFQYKAPFSPEDVIAEYTRPVRQRIGGIPVIKAPLSELELIDFPGVGVLEAFNTDGLRTLLRNTSVPTLIEKTLRYPGHAEYMQVLAQTGFFSEAPVEVDGQMICPRQLTAALLYRQWRMEPTEADFIVMDVRIGLADASEIRYYLMDKAEPVRQISAMARTTGYTCTALATWLLQQSILPPGIYAPEQIAQVPGSFPWVSDYLKAHGIQIARFDRPFPFPA